MSTDIFDRNAPRKGKRVLLNADLLKKAKQYGIDVAHACERGLAQEVAKHRAGDWAKENEEVIRSANEYVAKHGLPLAKYRRL
jgi:antitoxin CcdA